MQAQRQPIEAVVIGAGHAGLSTSYYLTQAGVPHVVLEKDRIGGTWRSKRWDSFTLVTPNWMCRLPGYAYAGDAPDSFMPRDEVVAYLERYAESFNAPVREDVRVMAIRQNDSDSPSGGYVVETDHGSYTAPIVVVATGFFEQPKIPAAAA
ncbi:MAG: putative flavoprotein involved in transport, partial [Chloroflexia bacterium]|nr:putative flavoprotein involved in transport [Chloroflexia bacterium]